MFCIHSKKVEVPKNLNLNSKLIVWYTVLLVELINSSASRWCLLLSCVEWMALWTDFYMDFFLCWTCYELVTAVTNNLCLIVIWMDSFSHFFHLLNHTCYHVLDIADCLLHNIRILSYHIKKFKHFFDISDNFCHIYSGCFPIFFHMAKSSLPSR